MFKQTGGEWSAPLDDVFIHFDYARATALGHPFEWTIGNGYSSGNTSLSYPFILAVGWILGFVDRDLMHWAALIAMMSMFGFFLVVRRLFIENAHDTWGKISSYLAPPTILSVGALCWSLWSGMEVAFFLGVWAIALLAWQRLDALGATHLLRSAYEQDATQTSLRRRAWALGAAGALLVATRPEAALTVGIFGASAAASHRLFGRRNVVGILLRVASPALAILMMQAAANKAYTGEWSANGAIVKLAINNPYLSRDAKIQDYTDNLIYAALRNLEYHFAHTEGEYLSQIVPTTWAPTNVFVIAARHARWAGIVPLAFGLIPLAFSRTRRVGLVLWAQIVTWVAVVALNGQVRWQNERYVMPAIAWLLLSAAIGVSAALRKRTTNDPGTSKSKPSLIATTAAVAFVVQVASVLTRPPGSAPSFNASWVGALALGLVVAFITRSWTVRALGIAMALLFAYDHQVSKMRDQTWFFGRASRNIRDQHLAIGKYLGERKPNRVLVGDAGAILYESNRPGLDVIGLGGLGKLPFARAGVHGLAATIELIERLPAAHRPDVLAIFPTWFNALPSWFSSGMLARFPVEGNVICGGYEQNVYEADWSSLGHSNLPSLHPAGTERVAATVDVADLVSEKDNSYAFEKPANGWADMHLLADPRHPQRDIFDGGRKIVSGRSESWIAKALTPGVPAYLIVRSAPEAATHVRVRVNRVDIGTLEFTPKPSHWVDEAIAIPKNLVTSSAHIELINVSEDDFLDVHEWIVQ